MGKYDDETRSAALDCLAANEGDYPATSDVTGVSEKTLRRWAKREHEQVSGHALMQLREELAALKTQIAGQPTPTDSTGEDDLRVWLHDRLLPHLIDDAMALSASIQEVIEDAPLSQRAGALNQVLDKIFKFSQLYPRTEESVLRVEFVDPDGTTHNTPFWAKRNPGE